MREVSTGRAVSLEPARSGRRPPPSRASGYSLDDCGLKYNILRILRTRGCEVIAYSRRHLRRRPPRARTGRHTNVPPGPGDPELLDYAVDTAKGLIGKTPIMGICLGNQIIARAFGGRNYKLKFGHRGGNHPVKEIATRPRPHHRPESRLRG